MFCNSPLEYTRSDPHFVFVLCSFHCFLVLLRNAHVTLSINKDAKELYHIVLVVLGENHHSFFITLFCASMKDFY
jgi:hypothetical protein